jgi:Replication initiation factor
MNKSLAISIHWLGITGHFDPSYMAKAFHQSVFSSKYPDNQFDLYPFEYQGVSGRGYQHIHQWSGTGAYLYVNPLDGAIHSHLELRGNFCEAFQQSLPNLLSLLKEAASEASLVCNTLTDFNPTLGKLNGTRLDIAFDHVSFTPKEQYAAYLSGEVVTRCRSFKWLENEDGSTFYLGSSKSDRLTRCYDRRGFTRLELQLRNAYADEVIKAMLNQQEWLGLAVSFLRGHADYTTPWWRSVIDESIPRSIPTIKLKRSGLDELRIAASKRVLNTLKEIAPLALGLGMDLKRESLFLIEGMDGGSSSWLDESTKPIRLACELRGLKPSLQNFRTMFEQYKAE